MFLEAKKGLWTQKNSFGSLKMLKKLIFGPQKMEKIDFLQNLDLPDLAEHGWGLPQYSATRSHWPFSWRIQYIKNLLPQWCGLQSQVLYNNNHL